MVHGYKLEWKPGDPCFYSVDMFELESYKDSAKIWALYAIPQPGCDQGVVVYKSSRRWTQPKYLHGRAPEEMGVPLYVGPLLFAPSRFDALNDEMNVSKYQH